MAMTDDRTVTTTRDAVALLRRLVVCDTSNPPGHEAQAAAVIEDVAAAAGLETERVAKDPERPNLVVRLPGRGGGPTLAFLGHLDVVPARRSEWSVDPFAGVERAGEIWGRGTVDMKCQVAASVTALAALAREGFRPSGDVTVLLMADEEVGSAGVGAPFFVEQRPDLVPDYLVGEGAGERLPAPTGPVYLLDHGTKATSTATLRQAGIPGDASLADAGKTALVPLAQLLLRLEQGSPPLRLDEGGRRLLDELVGPADTPEHQLARAGEVHPAFGRLLRSLFGTVVMPTVVAAEGPRNVVASAASATLPCAVLPGTTGDDLWTELVGLLGPGTYELEVSEPKGGLLSPLDTPLHAAIAEFLAEHDPEARLVPALGYGYSDCNVFRESGGTIAYGFIPFRHGDPLRNLAIKHGADERVSVEDLAFQVAAVTSVIRHLTGCP